MTLPQPSGEFEWVQASWGPALRCLAIPAPHLFSTRALELRHNDDGWRKLAVELGVTADGVLRPRQVHGQSVFVVPQAPVRAGTLLEDACGSAADIIMTRNPDVAVAVQAADCVPLLFFDPATGAVAAAHAGWRGTAAGVASAALRAMAQHFGTRPENLVVAIGPSIGPCCYRVGEELLGAFGQDGRRWFYHLGGGWMLNLWAANRDQLIDAGVDRENIHVAELCTAMHADLLDSYRRDGAGAGRLAAVIRSLLVEKTQPHGVATVGMLLVDDRGWILLQLRDEHGLYPHHWGSVGGAVEPGETLEAAIRREVCEETGYILSGSIGFGSSAGLVLPDGEVRYATLFVGRYDCAQSIRCNEGSLITFVDPSTLDNLQMYPGQKELILEALRRYHSTAALNR